MAETDGKKYIRQKSASKIDKLEEKLPPEFIEIKPKIDLIPDEFPRNSNQNMAVELVCGYNDREAQNFEKCLARLGYSITITDKDRQTMDEKIDDSWVTNVLQKVNDDKCDGLILVFAKVAYRNADITKLWSRFTAESCPNLKNKPKIFIFQIVKRAVSTDHTATSLNWNAAYETPAEADILIVHDIYEPKRDDLLGELTTAIEDLGEREDIITLTSLSYEYDYQPLIISTMTRTFYFTIHQHRGHHFVFHQKYEEIKKQLEEIKDKLVQKSESKVPKKKDSLAQFIKRTFSTKKKPNSEGNSGLEGASASVDGKNEKRGVTKSEKTVAETKPVRSKEKNDKIRNVDNKSNKKDEKERKTSTNVKPPLRSPVTKNPVRKTSVSGEKKSDNVEKRNSRIRTVSSSSDAQGDASKRKPSWKPI